MRKKIVISVIVFLVIIPFIFLFFKINFSHTEEVIINGQIIRVEIAADDQSRFRGLSGRDNLDENQGMLFVFPEADYHQFWMKEMLIPLDFVWINGAEVVDLTQNVPAPLPDTSLDELKIYTSVQPSDKVLELKAGEIERLDIRLGDEIEDK